MVGRPASLWMQQDGEPWEIVAWTFGDDVGS